MKTIKYSPLHKVQTLVASLLVGCQYNKDTNIRLVPDTVAAQLGLERLPNQSQTNILLQRLEDDNLTQLQAVHQPQLPYYAHCPSLGSWHGYLVVDVEMRAW